jgi:hypothetical protein
MPATCKQFFASCLFLTQRVMNAKSKNAYVRQSKWLRDFGASAVLARVWSMLRRQCRHPKLSRLAIRRSYLNFYAKVYHV